MSKKFDKTYAEEAQSIQFIRGLFDNGGKTVDGEQISISDAVTGNIESLKVSDAFATPNFPIAFKRVIEEFVIDAIEPNLIGHKLLQTIHIDPNITQVNISTYGAIEVGDNSVAEGGEYPEVSTTNGGGQLFAGVGKFGNRLRITEEMLRNSQWDVIAFHLNRLGRAMARAKEQNIFHMINSAGVTVFDNENPAQSILGRTTGRDISGAGNGSFTADDMYDMYANMLERGYKPNVILCHPLAWATFTKDPVLREYALKNGTLDKWFTSMPSQKLSGDVPEAYRRFSRMSGKPATPLTPEERVGTQDTPFQFPSYFPGTQGITIMTSHYVPFDAEKKTTSIIMLDTNELGAIFVQEEPTVDQWDDPARDIQNIKIRERYGLALFNDGQAVSIAKNVSIEPNEIVLPPQAVVSDLPRIQRK